MGHLLKLKCAHSLLKLRILSSTSVPFALTTVRVPNLALTHTKRITVQWRAKLRVLRSQTDWHNHWSRRSERLTWSCDHVGLTDWHDHVITSVWQTDMIMWSRWSDRVTWSLTMWSRQSDRLTWSCDNVGLSEERPDPKDLSTFSQCTAAQEIWNDVLQIWS